MRTRVLTLILAVLAASPAWANGSTETQLVQTVAPLRIITCGKAHALVLNALYMFPDASRTVVAFGKSSQVGGNFIFLLDPQARRRAVFAPDVGAEEILAHRPDRVVLKSYLKNGLGRQLEGLGVQVLYVDLESPEQYRRDIEAMGTMFGNPQRAQELNRFFEENLRQVQAVSARIPESEKPDTLLLYYGARSGTVSFNVPPKQWLQARLVRWAGGKPIWVDEAAGSGWQQTSFEQIAAWNPEYLFLVSYHTPVDEAKARLLSDSKWAELEAVKQGKLFAFPADYLSWDQPDPRWIIGLNWLAGKLHPDSFAGFDTEKKVREFYGFVYGLSADRIEEKIIPMIRGDFP
jgi:iron complex transport system substrate-binding protein